MKPVLYLALIGIAGFIGLGGVTGCGTGNDPLALIGNPNSKPSFVVPVSDINLNATTTTGNTMTFNVAGAADINVFAPASGSVSAVDQADGKWAVSILHNGRFVSRIGLLSIARVRVGDAVVQNQTIIGNVTTGYQVQFNVLVDGTAECPYYYLSSQSKNLVISRGLLGASVCQP